MAMTKEAITSDTICALATAPGLAGLAVVRCSGADSIEICDRFFRGKRRLKDAPSHSILFGWWYHENVAIDSVTISVFRAPHSYTGEEVVEIGSHGGYVVPDQIVSSLLSVGVRHAAPGEFTQRAFVNGKLDMTQVEAVADIIQSQSTIGALTAARQLAGGFTRQLSEIRSELLTLSGLLELELDFAEEDVEFVNRPQLEERAQLLANQCGRLADSARSAEILRSGFHVAVVGFPNAGKSTLFNALLQRNRAIVSDSPGTTRDFLVESIVIDGYVVQLADTAGLRTTKDNVEMQGILLTQSLMDSSNAILVLNDASNGFDASNELVSDIISQYPNRPVLLVHNKVDLATEVPDAIQKDAFGTIMISAKTGAGLDIIRAWILHSIKESTDSTLEVLVNQRQALLLRAAEQHICAALAAIKGYVPPDLVAIDLRSAVRSIGELTGETWNPDVLESVFSQFCIGK